MHVRGETRAEGFLDELTGSVRQRHLQKRMSESMNLSTLTARLTRLSQQDKNTPVGAEHLAVLAEFLMDILREFQDKIVAAIEDVKKSQRGL